MKNYMSVLSKNPLFDGLSGEEIQKLCACLTARKRTVKREFFVFHAGDSVRYIYLILSGSLHIIQEDFWGNRSIIETLQAHTLFAEAYVFSSAESHLVSVIAAEDATILEIDPVHLFEKCACGCSCHDKLIKNTVYILSEKIVRLTEKLGHIVKRTTREKILSYLSGCAQREQSLSSAHSTERELCSRGNSFDIPYSRQQLADYLCVDRSALSHELSKLQKQGMLRYHKNHFELLSLDDFNF